MQWTQWALAGTLMLAAGCESETKKIDPVAEQCKSLCMRDCSCVIGTTTGDIYEGCMRGCFGDGECSLPTLCQNAMTCEQTLRGGSSLVCQSAPDGSFWPEGYDAGTGSEATDSPDAGTGESSEPWGESPNDEGSSPSDGDEQTEPTSCSEVAQACESSQECCSNACNSPISDGQPCAVDGECASGVCEPNPSDEFNLKACAATQGAPVNTESICTCRKHAITCTSDEQCCPGMRCVDGPAGFQCQP